MIYEHCQESGKAIGNAHFLLPVLMFTTLFINISYRYLNLIFIQLIRSFSDGNLLLENTSSVQKDCNSLSMLKNNLNPALLSEVSVSVNSLEDLPL